VAVAIFIEAITTTGASLTLELALTATGVVLGLVATALMTVYRSPDAQARQPGGIRLRSAVGRGRRRARRVFVWFRALVRSPA
jgi:hypothetical protein